VKKTTVFFFFSTFVMLSLLFLLQWFYECARVAFCSRLSCCVYQWLPFEHLIWIRESIFSFWLFTFVGYALLYETTGRTAGRTIGLLDGRLCSWVWLCGWWTWRDMHSEWSAETAVTAMGRPTKILVMCVEKMTMGLQPTRKGRKMKQFG
jgi:hypothetical protein